MSMLYLRLNWPWQYHGIQKQYTTTALIRFKLEDETNSETNFADVELLKLINNSSRLTKRNHDLDTVCVSDLNKHRFLRFYFSIFSLGLVSIEKIQQTLKIKLFYNLTLLQVPGGTPYNGLYGEAPPERGAFFRLQVYKRVGTSQV